MAARTDVVINFGPADTSKGCCGNCQGQVHKVLHISNDHGFFTLSYTGPSSGFTTDSKWTTHYNITFNCAKHIPNPVDPGCLISDDDEVEATLRVDVTVNCPASVGGPWKITYSAPTEGTYFRFMDNIFQSGVCSYFDTRVASSTSSSSASTCDDTQTFPAPPATWHDELGHAYATAPTPGITVMAP